MMCRPGGYDVDAIISGLFRWIFLLSATHDVGEGRKVDEYLSRSLDTVNVSCP